MRSCGLRPLTFELRRLCSNDCVSLKRIFNLVLLAVALAGIPVFSQTQAPSEPSSPNHPQNAPTQPPGSEPQASPPHADQENAQPDQKITPEEAQDLFKSADEILHFASRQTGLPIKHEVKHKLTSRDEVQRFIEKRMKDDPDAKRMEESEFVMKKFGLLPEKFNLRTFMVSMLREQVAGYYDTKTKTMNLLDWLPPEAQKPVMAHELTHALQDQFVNLDKWEDGGIPEGKKLSLSQQLSLDEVRVARQSVTEGQAMLVLIDYSLAPLGKTSADSPDAVTMMEDQMMDGTGSPVFASAPLYIKRAMMFAYREGTEFEEQVLLAKGEQGAFKGTLENPPQDTHEVMQPRTYLAGEHIPLLAVPNYDKLLGRRWEQVDFGALGEFDVNVLMEIYANAATSMHLTPDWRGGYYYAAHRKGTPAEDVAFIYVSKWANEEAAEQFAHLFSNSWKQRYKMLRTAATPAKDDSSMLTKETDQGSVSVQRSGDVVIAVESFPEPEAAKLRAAALAVDAGEAQSSVTLSRPSRPMLDIAGFAAAQGFVLRPMLNPMN